MCSMQYTMSKRHVNMDFIQTKGILLNARNPAEVHCIRLRINKILFFSEVMGVIHNKKNCADLFIFFKVNAIHFCMRLCNELLNRSLGSTPATWAWIPYETDWMNVEIKQWEWVYWEKPAPDQVRFANSVAIVTVSEFKFPLFLSQAWVTSLSEMDNTEFPSFQGQRAQSFH